jgi:hypothetical protein
MESDAIEERRGEVAGKFRCRRIGSRLDEHSVREPIRSSHDVAPLEGGGATACAGYCEVTFPTETAQNKSPRRGPGLSLLQSMLDKPLVADSAGGLTREASTPSLELRCLARRKIRG